MNGAAARSRALSEASVPARIVFARIYVCTQWRDKTAQKQKVVAPACAGGSQRVACAVVVVECELAIVVCLGGGAAVQLQLFGSEQVQGG